MIHTILLALLLTPTALADEIGPWIRVNQIGCTCGTGRNDFSYPQPE